MKRRIYSFLIIAAIAYLGICVAMFVFQRAFIYFPQPRKVTAPESTLVLRVEGEDIVVSVRPHGGKKAIIYFGGNAEDVSQNLESFSGAYPDHALFLMHYRGYGGSTGSPTEQAIHSDAVALFQEVHAQYPEIAVIGRSLGTGVAVRLASSYPVSRLILVTPFDSMQKIAASAYPFLPVRLLLRDRYESGIYAPDINIPTTIIVAEFDEVIPRASTNRLVSRFLIGVATMKIIQGVGHNSLESNSEYIRSIQEALR